MGQAFKGKSVAVQVEGLDAIQIAIYILKKKKKRELLQIGGQKKLEKETYSV